MEIIFYLFTIVFLWNEVIWIIHPYERAKDAERFLELTKQFKNAKREDYSDEYKGMLKSKFILIFIILWMFLGLFTSQWVLFLAMLLFQFLVVSPLSNITRNTKYYVALHWINSIVGFWFGLFVIINHYHLKIDITNLIFSLIK